MQVVRGFSFSSISTEIAKTSACSGEPFKISHAQRCVYDLSLNDIATVGDSVAGDEPMPIARAET